MTDQRNQTKRIGVAMSGGVDSSVAAARLLEQGHRITGFYMTLAQPDLDRQVERVKKIADFLKIELITVDLAQEFEATVLDYFATSYTRGLTPNPCVICNPNIKFGRLLDAAVAAGCDFLATGHYARVSHDPVHGHKLLKGNDPKKDQSYFLCGLGQKQLARIIMPHGEQTKEEIYRMADRLGLAGRHGSESQDVCFLKDTSVGDFLAGRLKNPPLPGLIVNQDGDALGEHNGIHRFTVGQRRGLGIPDATPYYVVGLDPKGNRVIIGKEEYLWQDNLTAKNLNWLAGQPPELPARFTVKIRYRHQPAPALVEWTAPGLIAVKFEEPQRAITPGQFAVFYRNDELVGGGEIS